MPNRSNPWPTTWTSPLERLFRRLSAGRGGGLGGSPRLNDIIAAAPCRDIRWYGAVEDGSTDNNVAIQAAIDAAEQSAVVDKGRGIVFFPCVTGLGYSCAADIQIKDQIFITGGGMIKFTGTYGFESNAKSGWVIDGITIIGSETANQILIYIHNSSVKFWIRNSQFYKSPMGIFATNSFIFRIDDNDMYPSGMNNIVCIKLTSGEGNCSKGTAYGTVNDVHIRGNMLKEFGSAPSATPLIHIGDSALAPIDPKAVTHAKSIDISSNGLAGLLAENAIKSENTKNLTIDRNWFERFVGPPVYLAGQWDWATTIRANGFYGNNDDGYMDPAIKIDSTINWEHLNTTIEQNLFDKIHANHNFIEADYLLGLVISNNKGLTAARTVITNSTGVDIRQPEWSHIVTAFTDGDATPSVKFKKLFKTANTGATTITMFDDPTIGEPVRIIIDDVNTTIDFTGTNLKGNSGADWSPTTGDHMTGIFDGTDWYFDVSDNTA